ncbi:MAG: hypothetical protein FD129_977 [bacterium]|nr:MAG: hypothetical protein FD129_977 [bacterium]
MTEDQDETSPSEEGSVPSGGDSPEPIPGEIPVPQVKDVPVEGVDGGAGVDFEELIEAIREDDDRYAMDAYRFVRESLDWQNGSGRWPERCSITGAWWMARMWAGSCSS